MGELRNGTVDDAALVKQAAEGDPQAFGILYDRYSLNIYRFLCAQLSDPYEAEDLTSEVFLRAWRSLAGYQDRGYPFSTYLFRIARNAVIDHRRRSKLRLVGSLDQLNSLEDESPLPRELLAQNQEVQNLQKGLSRLREAYRSVLVLRFIVGVPTAEVAQIMKRSEGAIRVLQHRALKALRKCLEVE